ncbi:MAG: hypothetical protein ACMXYB_04425 [Candidatus Woesearchaeota archaeon]
MKQTIIVPRRRIYEHLLILEDFILDIERFLLYDKEMTTIYQYSHNDEFEPLLHEIIIKTIHLSNIFFANKVFNNSREFEKELQIQYKRNKERYLKEFKENIITHLDSSNSKFIERLLRFIKEHKRWGTSKELTNQFFELVDLYHSLLIKIIELPSQT